MTRAGHRVAALARDYDEAELLAAAARRLVARIIVSSNSSGVVATLDEAVARYRLAVLEAIEATDPKP